MTFGYWDAGLLCKHPFGWDNLLERALECFRILVRADLTRGSETSPAYWRCYTSHTSPHNLRYDGRCRLGRLALGFPPAMEPVGHADLLRRAVL